MDHDIAITGFAYCLRPLRMDDAAFIYGLRSDPDLTRYLAGGPKSLQDQQRWQEAYLGRLDDYCFVVERIRDHRPEGTIAVYEISDDGRRAEWGRWLIRRDSLAAAESVYLIHKISFEHLMIDTLYSRTNIENKKVVSFHDNRGPTRRSIVEDCGWLRGRPITAVEHAVERFGWPENGEVLRSMTLRVAQMAARRS